MKCLVFEFLKIILRRTYLESLKNRMWNTEKENMDWGASNSYGPNNFKNI